jgi:hypothetical protein
LKSEASVAGFAGLVPYVEINGLLATSLRRHQSEAR